MTTKIRGMFESRRIWLNDIELFPERSQKFVNHSPDGFNWGYGGSGPAQLALAILLNEVEPIEAREHYQEFKWDIIAALPSRDFEIEIDIPQWVKDHTK